MLQLQHANLITSEIALTTDQHALNLKYFHLVRKLDNVQVQ
jgi:hypothetical protein